jgi:hypothetical protein
LLFSRQAKQSRTSNRVMRFPQLPSFTFFAEIKFSVGTVYNAVKPLSNGEPEHGQP